MDKRIGCYSNHRYNNHDWVNEVGIDCKSGCESDYTSDNGGHQRGMTNEIHVHDVAARLDDKKLNGDHMILFEPI